MTRGRARPATRRRPLDAGAQVGDQIGRLGRCPVAEPGSIDSSTSSRVCGSMVSTSAVQPRCSSASSTTDTSTAQTAHRSWVTTRSASRSRNAASKVVEVVATVHRRHHKASISAGTDPRASPRWRRSSGSAPRPGSRTRRSPRRRPSPAPIAKRISVVEGRSDTMRTRSILGSEGGIQRLRWTARRGRRARRRPAAGDSPALAAGYVDAVVGGGGLIQLRPCCWAFPARHRCRCWRPESWSVCAGPR